MIFPENDDETCDDEIDGVSLRLPVAFTVRVRYVYTGRMKSLPYDFDEE